MFSRLADPHTFVVDMPQVFVWWSRNAFCSQIHHNSGLTWEDGEKPWESIVVLVQTFDERRWRRSIEDPSEIQIKFYITL